MNVKRILSLALAGSLLTCTALLVAGCSKGKQDESWKENTAYDLSVPTLGQDGWYLVFQDDFEGDGLNQNIQFGDNYTGSFDLDEKRYAKSALQQQGAFCCVQG